MYADGEYPSAELEIIGYPTIILDVNRKLAKCEGGNILCSDIVNFVDITLRRKYM